MNFFLTQFPELLSEITTAKSLNQTSDSDDSDDDNELAARAAQQQFAQLVHDELTKHVQQQQSVHSQLLKEIENTKRLDAQRVYREKLGEQGIKRKERRRKVREQANYQKYVAKIERKRLEQAAPLAADHQEEANNGPRGSGTTVEAQPELLAWEKAAIPRRGSRPQWVSRQVWTNQQQCGNSGPEHKSQVLLSQCQRMFDTLQLATERKQQQQRPRPRPLVGSDPVVGTGGRARSSKRVTERPETAP